MARTKSAPRDESRTAAAGAAPVVVGFDGSEEGRDGLELARVLCEIRGAPCIVATVEDGDPEPIFAQARKALSGLAVETRLVGTRSPGRMLAEFAAREGAATLVVGAPHRRTGAGRALLGSVAEHLLHHSPCEVAIAPRGYGDTSLSHVGLGQISVAFDGTAESRRALRHAEDLAEASAATIQIVVAQDPLVTGIEAEAGEAGGGEGILDQAVNSVRDSLAVDGKTVEPEGRETVTHVAAAIAAACDGDVVVCGSRPPRDRVLLASVTKRVIEVSRCPVLIVPPSPGE
ncbi:MAG: universal stress protein [Solirubrobacterales bacterium]